MLQEVVILQVSWMAVALRCARHRQDRLGSGCFLLQYLIEQPLPIAGLGNRLYDY